MKNLNQLIKGFANFEGDESTSMKALIYPNDRWNGWAKPYIHISSIPKMLGILNYSEDTYTIINGDLVIKCFIYGFLEYENTIAPIEIEGEIYYYLGNEGLVFDFEESK